MFRNTLSRFLPGKKRRPASRRFVPTCERLSDRIAPAVAVARSSLVLTGNNHANPFVVSRTPGGTVLVNNHTVPTPAGALKVAWIAKIVANGKGGDDTITLDETKGPLKKAVLRGGDGN